MKSILFLCMGNICRSPAAHCVLQFKIDQAKLSKSVIIDSAGTINYHSGKAPDTRMQNSLKKRNIPIIGNSRQITNQDLRDFDLILAMDQNNLRHANKLDHQNEFNNKIKLFSNYCTNSNLTDIPDPYFENNFEEVLNLIEDGCNNILREIIDKNKS